MPSSLTAGTGGISFQPDFQKCILDDHLFVDYSHLMEQSKTAISLFSSGGIGDLALRQAGFEIVVSNELLDDRHTVYQTNFPKTTAITGDIWNCLDELERCTLRRLRGRPLTLFYATPPCQGMSKNGRGKLLSAIRAGQKPPFDPRNRLIVPAMELARRLRPEIVLLENVPEMASTLILDRDGTPVQIVDFVRRQLGESYVGSAEVIEFADFGVPQCRQRLITVFARDRELIDWFYTCGTFMPPRSHTPNGDHGTSPWVTVRDTIETVPPLDAKSAEFAISSIPFHRVPLLDPMKYWWVENTPPERSAFDNQCTSCGFQGNRPHTARRDRSGINRASRETPLYCEKCDAMLPRPSVKRQGERSLMRGYTSAYKRMAYDRPASALTRNLSYACSDNKLHPTQNRVLSLYEAFRLHTLDRYDYKWARPNGQSVSNKTIREIVGESIPPAGLQAIVEYLLTVRAGRDTARRSAVGQRPQFKADVR